MRSSQDIVNDINQFEPADGNWLELETLLNDLWSTGKQENFTIDLLRVFERFPGKDGAGVFWSIIHGVETFRSYESELVDSLNRQPSEMGLLMLRRIKNSGASTLGGVEIDKIVRDLLSNEQLTPALKEAIMKIIK
jgi:hypothetical protein